MAETEKLQDTRVAVGIAQHIRNYRAYVCECGARCQILHPDWKWNGKTWQHRHKEADS